MRQRRKQKRKANLAVGWKSGADIAALSGKLKDYLEAEITLTSGIESEESTQPVHSSNNKAVTESSPLLNLAPELHLEILDHLQSDPISTFVLKRLLEKPPRTPLTLLTLPPECQLKVFSLLDPVSSTCLALAYRRYYPVHLAVHGMVPLETELELGPLSFLEGLFGAAFKLVFRWDFIEWYLQFYQGKYLGDLLERDGGFGPTKRYYDRAAGKFQKSKQINIECWSRLPLRLVLFAIAKELLYWSVRGLLWLNELLGLAGVPGRLSLGERIVPKIMWGGLLLILADCVLGAG